MMSQIRIMRTVAGEEILGEILDENVDFIKVRNPCAIGLVMNERGQPSLNIQRLLMFSVQTEIDIRRSNILYETDVDSKIETKYNEIFGNIILPQKSIII